VVALLASGLPINWLFFGWPGACPGKNPLKSSMIYSTWYWYTMFRDGNGTSGVIDWALIQRHWVDLLQVVLSIQAGDIVPSMLLRKLGTLSRKNEFYTGHRGSNLHGDLLIPTLDNR
jgi:hypothetical protein